MPQRRTTALLRDELPQLLAIAKTQRLGAPTSVRQLAASIGVNQGYLSRMLNGTRPMPATVAAAVAAAFDLPSDYFPEYRAGLVVEAARHDPSILDRIYDELAKRRT